GFGAQAQHLPTAEALIEALREALSETDAGRVVLLVKGSRSSRMERVVAALTGTTVAEAH
ncbi:MAG: hypothetical protein OSA97_15945, partial [Nevskia sp.]|nr:hypothetical protein [Nevskia sp.]